jgi:hypothetical protein
MSPLRRRTHAAERGIRHFDVTFTVWYTLVIMPATADAFLVVGGSARAEDTGARPGRGVVKRPLRHLDLTFTLVRFWGRVDRVTGFIW